MKYGSQSMFWKYHPKKLEEIPNWNDSGNETFNTVSKNLTSSEHHVEITMSGLDN